MQNKFCLQNLFCEKTRFLQKKKRVFSNSINLKVYRGMRFFCVFCLQKTKKSHSNDTPGIYWVSRLREKLAFREKREKTSKSRRIFRKCVAFTKDFFGISEKIKRRTLMHPSTRVHQSASFLFFPKTRCNRVFDSYVEKFK